MKFIRHPLFIILLVALLTAGCRSDQPAATPDYPVTVVTTNPPEPASTATSTPVATPTLGWDQVTLLPPPVAETEDKAEEANGQAKALDGTIPDPLTDADSALLAAAGGPFTLNDTELTLGWILLPVDLLAAGGSFRVASVAVDDYPGWRFLAFDLPLPADGDLGLVIRSPMSGQVMPGTMQMLNERIANTISIDHPIEDGLLLRATFVYSGTIDPFFSMGQQVEAGEALFRLTRDSDRVNTLGNTPIPDGAVLTLHASIDTVVKQESGVDSLKFLRGVSLTPAGFIRDDDGRILSPINSGR
jgi:hypothetical protein